MSRTSGAEVFVRTLKSYGVKQLFGLPGVATLPIYDACLSHDLPTICGRHEAAVVETAEGWARVSGETAVALVPGGPGHANSIGGIAAAYAEGSPVIVVSGVDAAANLGRGALQELPQVEMSAPITKWSTLVWDAKRIPECLANAFRIARTATPGPVYISITADCLTNEVEDPVARPDDPIGLGPTDAAGPDAEFVAGAIDVLAEARRPAIVVGSTAFWAKAAQPVRDLVELTHIPIFTSCRARGIIPDTHPYCFGDVSPKVNPVFEKLREADAILLIGEKIDWQLLYGEVFGDAKLIQIDPAASEIGKNRRVARGIACDCRAATVALLAAARERTWRKNGEWIHELGKARRTHEEWRSQPVPIEDGPVHPHHLVQELGTFLDKDSILVFDGADISFWGRTSFRAMRLGGWQKSGAYGAIGVGLPYAIGAKLAAPEAPVVLLTGDGAFGFAAVEMDTAIRYNIPVVIVVGNNAVWGSEHFYQTQWYGADRAEATKLCNVRWDEMARAFGGCGEHVDTGAKLRPALERAFAAQTLACVNVETRFVPSPVTHRMSRLMSESVAHAN